MNSLSITSWTRVWVCLVYCAVSGATIDAQEFVDPPGDTIGELAVQHDILSVTGLQLGSVSYLRIRFASPVTSLSSGAARGVAGFVDIDSDENAATGISDQDADFAESRGGIHALGGLGVDFYIDLFAEAADAGWGDLVDAKTRQQVGRVPLRFVDNLLSIDLANSLIQDDGRFSYGVVVGTLDEPTDEALGISLVPEPSSATLGIATVGLLAVFQRRRSLRRPSPYR